MIPEMQFLAEQVTGKLFPLAKYGNLGMEFNLNAVEALDDDQGAKVSREAPLRNRGVITINEVHRPPQPAGYPLAGEWGKAAGRTYLARGTGRDQILVEPSQRSGHIFLPHARVAQPRKRM